jgi:hypothetical protein
MAKKEPATAPPRQMPGRVIDCLSSVGHAKEDALLALRNMESTAVTTRELKASREERL